MRIPNHSIEKLNDVEQRKKIRRKNILVIVALLVATAASFAVVVIRYIKSNEIESSNVTFKTDREQKPKKTKAARKANPNQTKRFLHLLRQKMKLLNFSNLQNTTSRLDSQTYPKPSAKL